MTWLLLVSAVAGIYLFGLAGYRLFLSGKALSRELKKAAELLTELNAYDRTLPTPAKAAHGEDFAQTLAERRALVRAKIRRQEERRRRLINRIREIDVDKRWS